MNRNKYIFAIVIIAFWGSIATLGAVFTQRSYELRGNVDASRSFALPYKVPRLGVNVELTQYSPPELEHQLDLMKNTGVTWIRQPIRWSDIESKRGEFEWAQLDSVFQQLQSYPDLRVIAVITTSPSWARNESYGATAPPVNPSAIRPFLAAFTARYATLVDHYQIWDEPNLQSGWGGTDPHPASYVSLLAEAFNAIHDGDPEATVIAAALAPTIETGPKNINDLLYLRDMYAVGAKGFMDAVAAKPYGFNTSAYDRNLGSGLFNFSRAILIREEMVRQGDEHKALWFSNWGWNRDQNIQDATTSIWGGVSAEDQIKYTLEALNRVEREWPWVAGMTLQSWQPNAPDNDPIWGFALVNPDNTTTALYQAIQDKYQVNTVASNGLFSASNPYARYSGVWTFGPLGADIGWVQDSQFEFTFTGTNISILLRKGNYTAHLYPTVDDKPVNALPRDASGNSYVVLTSASTEPETSLIPIATDLSPGKHTLKVVADKGWDRWAIAGFGVSDGDLTAHFDRQLLIMGFAALLTLITMIQVVQPLNWAWISAMSRVAQARVTTPVRIMAGGFASVGLLIGMLLTVGEGIPTIIRREPLPLIVAFLTLGVVKFQPGIIVAGLCLLTLFLLIYSDLHLGLILTIFWSPFFLFPVELYRFFPMSELAILVTGCAWFIRVCVYASSKTKLHQQNLHLQPIVSIRRQMHPIDYMMLLWGILGIVSLLWSQQRSQALTELRVMILEPILFYAVFRTSKLNQRQIANIIYAFLFAGIVVAVIGLWQYYQGQAIITAEAGAQRLASVYGSPNNVALFLGRCIPFVLAGTIMVRGRRWRLLSVFILAILLFTVLLTQSVGAIFIGIPISIIAVIAIVWKKHICKILVVSLFVLVAGFLVSVQFPRFARVLDFSNGTNFFRLRVWESAINAIQEHPITGLGLDQFLYMFRSRYILPDAWQEPGLSHPHNIVLDYWVRLGIFGVILLLCTQYWFWKNALQLLRIHATSNNVCLLVFLVGTIGSMINLVAHGMIDNSVFVQDLSYVFVMLLAIVATLTSHTQQMSTLLVDTNPMRVGSK